MVPGGYLGGNWWDSYTYACAWVRRVRSAQRWDTGCLGGGWEGVGERAGPKLALWWTKWGA